MTAGWSTCSTVFPQMTLKLEKSGRGEMDLNVTVGSIVRRDRGSIHWYAECPSTLTSLGREGEGWP